MSELKPCPFCGPKTDPDYAPRVDHPQYGIVFVYCPSCDYFYVGPEYWNTRPVEDALKDDLIVALRDRNDALASVDRLTIERDDARLAAERMRTKRDALRAALRELVEANERLIDGCGCDESEYAFVSVVRHKIAKAKEVLG